MFLLKQRFTICLLLHRLSFCAHPRLGTGKKSLGEDLWLIESVYGSANCVIGIFFSALYDGVFGFFVSFVVFVPNEIRWASSITSPN